MDTRSGLRSMLLKGATGACTLMLAIGLTGCSLTTPSRSEVQPETVAPKLTASDLVEEGYLTVAMDTADAPQAMTDDEGKPSGYYGDVARALAENLGLDLKIVSASSAANSVGKGEADVFVGAKASDASDDMTVTSSVVENASAVFTKTSGGSSRASSLSADTLSNSTVGVQESSASQDALARAGIGADQSTYPNVNKCFDALAAGEVDYVVCDATAGAYLSRAYPGTVFAGTLSSVSSYGIALSDTGDVADVVGAAYEDLLDNGVIDAIHTAWYGDMPLSLSDTLLSGVKVTSDASSKQEGSSGASDTDVEDGGMTIGEDINSLG